VLLGTGIIERQIATVAGVGAAVVALSGWTYHVLHQRLRLGRSRAVK
jgi:hypothetical protein